jgi:F-type H+-transporting ATPase subunit b
MKMNQEIVWERVPSPVQAERSPAAAGCQNIYGFVSIKVKARPAMLRLFLAFALFPILPLLPTQLAHAQEQPAPQAAQRASTEPAKKEGAQPAPEPKGIGGQLVEEKREATGADEEEHADLKHSSMVQLLARKTGLSVHEAHLIALWLNFAIVVIVIFWAARKMVPGMLRARNASIQQALEEARTASRDANRRLADIENRLRKLDAEITQMQASAEKEATAEEARIHQAAEEEIRKVVQAAEQEIATAVKQARRELSNHTASLAIALARQQINVDSKTDQVLVRDFAANLSGKNGGKGGQ